jgi:hypothetical protein
VGGKQPLHRELPQTVKRVATRRRPPSAEECWRLLACALGGGAGLARVVPDRGGAAAGVHFATFPTMRPRANSVWKRECPTAVTPLPARGLRPHHPEMWSPPLRMTVVRWVFMVPLSVCDLDSGQLGDHEAGPQDGENDVGDGHPGTAPEGDRQVDAVKASGRGHTCT